MPAPQKPIPDCFIFLLAKAYQKAQGRFKKALEPFGLTTLQHLVLEGLWYGDGQTASELAKLLVLDKATLSGVLDRLQEAGWIDKRPDDEDRRVSRLYTTPKADSAKNELIAVRIDTNEVLLDGFNLEERLLLKRFLRELMGGSRH